MDDDGLDRTHNYGCKYVKVGIAQIFLKERFYSFVKYPTLRILFPCSLFFPQNFDVYFV